MPIFFFGLSLGSFENYLSTMGRGATNQTELSRATVADLPFILPTKTLVETFEEFAQRTFLQVVNLSMQNRKLQEARDLLLPRLMNGELAA